MERRVRWKICGGEWQARLACVVLLVVSVNPALTGYSFGHPVQEVNMLSPKDKSLPRFDTSQSTEVIAFVGQAVYLPCTVENLRDKLVSWIRSRDLNILTHGPHTFTADPRFEIVHKPESDSWSLKIRNTRVNDTGKYECQVNTDPKMNLFFKLIVRDSPLEDSPFVPDYVSTPLKASISGPREQYVKVGSTVTFVCALTYQESFHGSTKYSAAKSSPSLQWLHDGLAVSFQAERGGISVETERTEREATGRLTVAGIQHGDAGRYTCTSAGATPDSVRLIVLDGEHVEAMQRDQAANGSTTSHHQLWFIIIPVLLVSCILSRICRSSTT